MILNLIFTSSCLAASILTQSKIHQIIQENPNLSIKQFKSLAGNPEKTSYISASVVCLTYPAENSDLKIEVYFKDNVILAWSWNNETSRANALKKLGLITEKEHEKQQAEVYVRNQPTEEELNSRRMFALEALRMMNDANYQRSMVAAVENQNKPRTYTLTDQYGMPKGKITEQ